MQVLEGEVITVLQHEELLAQREIDDWLEERRGQVDQEAYHYKSLGILTFCVNDLEGITDGERGLLREMLAHATNRQLCFWGMTNLHRKQEVWDLFEKIKVLIRA